MRTMRLWQKWLGRKVVGSNPVPIKRVFKKAVLSFKVAAQNRALGKNQVNAKRIEVQVKIFFVILSWNQFSIFKLHQRFPWHLNRHQASWQQSPVEYLNLTGCSQVTWRHLHPIRFLRAGTSGEIDQVYYIELEHETWGRDQSFVAVKPSSNKL